ncbi:MAG TPA: tetratricopeptide repeat protein, partial [Casimicrobiaceae bacterium]|nr:tetratricopeptide repeat protein [Casimicrobiaceae bacterium]
MSAASVAKLPARNAPCPCGSGRRYKECHGAVRIGASQWVERALRELRARDFAAAEASLQEAERLAPDDPRILANLGTVYVRQRRLVEAEALLARVLSVSHDHPYVLTLLAHVRQRLCAWEGLCDLHARIGRLLETGDDAPADFNPFVLLAMPTTPQQQLAAARRFARGLERTRPLGSPVPAPAAGQRLRIGFVSSDFRSHATVSLMQEFWERLDRDRFEIFAYGILARDPGATGQRVERAFEHFVDVAAEPDERVAARIREDRVGILLDLNGYTRNGRPGIFAHRPAPLQVNAIGFQCTLGTSWHDYILCDRYCIPE